MFPRTKGTEKYSYDISVKAFSHNICEKTSKLTTQDIV